MDTDFQTIYTQLQKDLQVENVHAVPRISKVVVNSGVGKNRENRQYMEAVEKDLAAVTGQRAEQRVARKAVSGFNVREGHVVGYRVTLRDKRMNDFVKRFVHVTLPRVRDFRGIPLSGLDRQGNLHVGLSEQLAFAEIHPDQTDIIFGVQATFVTSTDDREQAEALFRALGFPFQQPEA